MVLLAPAATFVLDSLYGVFATNDLANYVAFWDVFFRVLRWALVLTSCALAVLVVATWPGASAAGRRGLVLAGLGLAFHWGWWLLNQAVDLFGLREFTQESPELVRLATTSFLVDLAVDVIVMGLLIAGGLLLRTARPAPEIP